MSDDGVNMGGARGDLDRPVIQQGVNYGRMRVTDTRTLRGPASELTVGDILALVDGQGDDVKVRVNLEVADRPGEISQIRLTVGEER